MTICVSVKYLCVLIKKGEGEGEPGYEANFNAYFKVLDKKILRSLCAIITKPPPPRPHFDICVYTLEFSFKT